MLKKLMLLLTTGILAAQLLGCGSGDTGSVDDGSAVEESAADSVSDSDVVPVGPSQQYDEEETIYEKAEIACDLPGGFVAYEEDEGLYVRKNYPTDLSTISYVISEGEEDVTQMTQDEYAQMIEDDLLENYGDDIDVNIAQYARIKIDGRPGVKIRLSYELKGTVYEQLTYMLYNGDETHILTFTQEEGAGWMDDFEESGATIHFVATE